MTKINDPEHPVILFIPEAGIYPYLRTLAVLGDAVQKQGGRVLVTRDSGQMIYSPMMAKTRMPQKLSKEQRENITKANDKNIGKVMDKYKFEVIELANFVDKTLLKEVDSLVDENKDIQNTKFRGFEVGKIAQYDFSLATKFIYSKDLSPEHRDLYAAYVKNTALTVALVDQICQKYQPALFLTFNDYAQCQAVRYGAERYGANRLGVTFPTHLGFDASRPSLFKSTYEYWLYNHCQKWGEVKDLAIPPTKVEACFDDSIFRMYTANSSHIFSAQKQIDPSSIFEKLKLDPKKRTVVVYTSSKDERVGIDIAMEVWGEEHKVVDVFESQIEWLETLRKYAEARDDIQIIVRIHPREGKRKFGYDSGHLTQLRSIFTKDTEKFMVVWPEDPISSYDLLELAHVVLVAWSLMGVEASRLGIPVLSYNTSISYSSDDDFMQFASTKEEYTKKLEAILNTKSTFYHLTKAVRYYHWRTFVASLDLGETVPTDFKDERVWPKAPEKMVGIINDLLSGKEDLISYNFQNWQNSIDNKSGEEETKTIKQGIRKFLDKIFYPPNISPAKKDLISRLTERLYRKLKLASGPKETKFVDYNLEYTEDISQIETLRQRTLVNKDLRILVAEGLYANLLHQGKVLRRMSPMATRLAKLHFNG